MQSMIATIDKLFAKYEKDLLSVYRLSSTFQTSNVVTFTPVDEGSARASWTPSKNQARTDNINIGEGDDRRHNISAVINSLTLKDDYYCSNGQPYIRWLEYMSMTRNGKYIVNKGQAGHMLTRAKGEWSKVVNRAIKAL